MRRFGLGIFAGAAFVVATGMWVPAHANVTDFGIDSPNDSEVTTSHIINVGMHADSDGSGLQYMRLDLKGPNFAQRQVWCAPRDSSGNCASWQKGDQATYKSSFAWDTSRLTSYNGDYTLTFTVREIGGQPLTQSRSVSVNTPPATPSWSEIAPSTDGGAHVTLRWIANSEPDITSYRISRAGGGGTTTVFTVNPLNPSDGCSSSGNGFQCTDRHFGSSGYGGTYTYYLTAYRHSPVSSDGVSSGQASRAASISESSRGRPSTGGTPGSGPGGSGSGPGPGTGPAGSGPAGSGPGFISHGGGLPASFVPVDPNAVNKSDFYSGSYEKSLPYSKRTTVLGVKTKRESAGFAPEDGAMPLNARKTLLSIAGGLFTIIAALHFRRVLRDS
ncbi:MAG: hypothetical protein NVSMB57_02230 [Actinomycetota bacterium]